jgi:hypothetical protein
MKVPNFTTARDRVAKIASSVGGRVVGGQVRVTDKGKSHGWQRLIVPAAQLDAAMAQLRGIGTVFGDTLTLHDLSLETQDLASRTTRLVQHQNRLLNVLQSPRRLRGSDILFVQDRLLRAGMDQDLLGHRRDQLVKSADVSNISVYLFEPGSIVRPPAVPVTFWDKTAVAFTDAWKSFSKFWVPVLIVLVVVWRKVKPLRRWPNIFRRPGAPQASS